LTNLNQLIFERVKMKNLIEQVEEILKTEIKTPDPGFVVSVHQINDDWFVAEFLISITKYKNWFDHLLRKGRIWHFKITVPYYIQSLIAARKISKDKLSKTLTWDYDEIISFGDCKKVKRSQLRKWGKIYQDVDKKLQTAFCTCGNEKDGKRVHYKKSRGFN